MDSAGSTPIPSRSARHEAGLHGSAEITTPSFPPPAPAPVSRGSRTRLALCDASLPADLAEILWNSPETLVTRGQILRHVGPRRTVLLEWASKRFVLKYYAERSPLHEMKRWGRRSRARATWNVMHKLADAGIRTPRPVACVENRWGPLRRDSFLMYPYVDGQTLRWHLESDRGRARTARCWRQLKELWQRLRELRVSLSDTNLRNFIVCPQGLVWAIDFDGTRRHRSARVAAHYQQRAWKRLLRSAAACRRRAAAA